MFTVVLRALIVFVVLIAGVRLMGKRTIGELQPYEFVITLAVLLASMMLANLLRRRIGALKKSLLPSSVLGGFIVLLLEAAYRAVTGNEMLQLSTLEALTYHGLGLGFIALAWRHLDGVKGKKARRDVFATATVTVGGYLIQAATGLLISVCLFYLVLGLLR